MVDRPYFNEPGYGSPCDNAQSNAYSKQVRKDTIRVAMYQTLTNPPKCFERVARKHFKLKKGQIEKQINTWSVDEIGRKFQEELNSFS
jgi:hypothetical protein